MMNKYVKMACVGRCRDGSGGGTSHWSLVLRLRTIGIIVDSRVSQRRCFRSKGSGFQVQESFVYWKQRLATDQDCSTVVYILGESMIEVWENIWYVCVNSVE